MKLSIKTLKPRNPFVAAGLQRKAGSHRLGTGSARLRARRELQREVERIRPSP